MDEFYTRKCDIVSKYKDGYFGYVVTITFKPNVSYSVLHPRQAFKDFKTHFVKYVTKKNNSCYMCPELGNNGNFHLHGLLFFKGEPYDQHEKKLKLFKNYMSRNYGFHYFQRIYNYKGIYKVQPYNKYYKKDINTTFDKVWTYLHKDQLKDKTYSFWSIIDFA